MSIWSYNHYHPLSWQLKSNKKMFSRISRVILISMVPAPSSVRNSLILSTTQISHPEALTTITWATCVKTMVGFLCQALPWLSNGLHLAYPAFPLLPDLFSMSSQNHLLE